MPRVDADSVRLIIESDSTISVDSFIVTANAITNHVDSCDGDGLVSEELLVEIEKYLAAHFYALRDGQAQSEKTGDASITYQGQTGEGLSGTWWGKQAIAMDVSGCLAEMDLRSKQGVSTITLDWLGTEVT